MLLVKENMSKENDRINKEFDAAVQLITKGPVPGVKAPKLELRCSMLPTHNAAHALWLWPWD